MSTRVGFIQDASADNELERRYAVQELEAEIGGEFLVVWAGTAHETPLMPDVDMLLVDYGGLAPAYGDAVTVYGECVRQWADDHPGKPVVLWTAYTVECYGAVFSDFEREAGNVFARYAGRMDWDGYPDLWDRLRPWLSVPEDAPRNLTLNREIEAAGPLVAPD